MSEERYVKQIVSDVMEMAAKIKFLEAKVAASESWNAECAADHDAALRRAKAEGVLKWTEDLPEKPGKYWWKLHPDSEPEIMSVLAYADGSAMPHCDYGQWAGPITPPLDARAAQIEEGE